MEKEMTAKEFWQAHARIKTPEFHGKSEYEPRIYPSETEGFYIEMEIWDVKTTSKWRRCGVSKEYMLGLRDWIDQVLPREKDEREIT